MPKESKDKKIEVYYDGVCNLCAGLAEKIDLSNRGAAFALKDANTDLPRGLTHDTAMRDIHVVDEKGEMHTGWRAAVRIMKEYPHLKWIAFVAEIPPFNLLAALLYRIVEKTRYWIFGRKNNTR